MHKVLFLILRRMRAPLILLIGAMRCACWV